jgi:Tfp pilus assembly protein PilF
LTLIDQGVAHLREGDTLRAASAFKLSAEVAPSAAALDGLGCVAMLNGHLKEAEQLFYQAVDLDPQYGQAYANLALLYEATGNDELARESFNQALELDPAIATTRNNYAAFLAQSSAVDHDRGERMLAAQAELLKAQALLEHPIIEENLKLLKEEYGTEQTQS